jgi:hypothetical protein
MPTDDLRLFVMHLISCNESASSPRNNLSGIRGETKSMSLPLAACHPKFFLAEEKSSGWDTRQRMFAEGPERKTLSSCRGSNTTIISALSDFDTKFNWPRLGPESRPGGTVTTIDREGVKASLLYPRL